MLPVTWYHYPVALIPAAVALAVTRASSRPRIVLAAAVADLAVAFLPLAADGRGDARPTAVAGAQAED